MAGSSSSHERVGSEEGAIDQPVAHQHVDHGEGQGSIAAGKGLQMHVGLLGNRVAHRVDHDHRARRLLQPVLVLVRRGGGGVRAPDDDAVRVFGGARVEADCGRADRVVECDVAGHVAHRVGLDLAGAQAAQEAHWEVVGDQRAGAGVVRVHDPVRAVALGNPGVACGDVPDGLLPRDRLEAPFALGAGALERRLQTYLGIAEDAVVGKRALAAERTPAHRVVRVAEHAGDRAVALDRDDAAGVVAIARAGGLEDFLLACHCGLRNAGSDRNLSLRVPPRKPVLGSRP